MTSALGGPLKADSSYGNGDHDLRMGSMVEFHQKMVKDAEEQKPLVPIVARLLAKLVDSNDKARITLIVTMQGASNTENVADACRQGNHCIPRSKSAGGERR